MFVKIHKYTHKLEVWSTVGECPLPEAFEITYTSPSSLYAKGTINLAYSVNDVSSDFDLVVAETGEYFYLLSRNQTHKKYFSAIQNEVFNAHSNK